MKRLAYLIPLVLASVAPATVLAQGYTPGEKRAFREYVSPQELVSIAPSTSLDKALAAISEVSQKFIGKIIIDTERRTMPINIDIQGMQWRDALEAICRKNDLWYTEYENYVQISGTGQVTGAPGVPGAPAAPVSAEIPREAANFRSREVRISAVFFDANLTKLDEVGINWSFMKTPTSGLKSFSGEFLGADKVTDKIFKVEIEPKVSFGNITFLARFFSNYDLGEVLSAPEIVVRSGEQGRIQVGQDFSIRERDFAGNLIDKFYSTGVIVRVTPQVVTEQGVNFVHMKVNVERSSVVPGTVSTIINKYQAETNLLLLDGEETIIGGLYQNEVNTVRSGVPFLKDLPWYVFGLRYLFGYDRDEVKKKELIILLKSDLVPTLQERITQKAKEDGLHQRWLQEQLKRERRMSGK